MLHPHTVQVILEILPQLLFKIAAEIERIHMDMLCQHLQRQVLAVVRGNVICHLLNVLMFIFLDLPGHLAVQLLQRFFEQCFQRRVIGGLACGIQQVAAAARALHAGAFQPLLHHAPADKQVVDSRIGAAIGDGRNSGQQVFHRTVENFPVGLDKAGSHGLLQRMQGGGVGRGLAKRRCIHRKHGIR